MTTPEEIFTWLDEPVDRRDTSYSKAATAYLLDIWAEVRDRIGSERFDSVLGETRAGKFGRRAAAAWTQTNGDHEGDLVNLWEHTHEFEEDGPGATVIRDRGRYSIPFGPLGELANRLLVRRDLKQIIDYCRDAVERELSPAQ